MPDDEFITSDPIEVESDPPRGSAHDAYGHGAAHGGHGHTHSHGHAEHGGFGHNDIAAEHGHDAATVAVAATPPPEPEQAEEAEESPTGQEEPGLIVVLAQTAQRIAPSTPEARVRLTCIFSAMLLAGIAIAIAMPKRR